MTLWFSPWWHCGFHHVIPLKKMAYSLTWSILWWPSGTISFFLHLSPHPTAFTLLIYNCQLLTLRPLLSHPTILTLSTTNSHHFPHWILAILPPFSSLLMVKIFTHLLTLLAFICKKLQVFELQILIRFEVERERVWRREGENLR